MHRDIKPGNLFLCDSGPVKIADFGIAKAVSETRLTATGTLVGTFPYMAPEQWLGEPATFSNDICAIGCVLYDLLSGALPRSYATPRSTWPPPRAGSMSPRWRTQLASPRGWRARSRRCSSPTPATGHPPPTAKRSWLALRQICRA